MGWWWWDGTKIENLITGTHVNKLNSKGNTSLMQYVEDGDFQGMVLVVKVHPILFPCCRADVEGSAKTNKWGWYCKQQQQNNNNNNGNNNEPNNEGANPESDEDDDDDDEIPLRIIDKSLNMNMRNEKGNCALWKALINKRPYTMKCLMHHGARNVEKYGSHWDPLLHIAVCLSNKKSNFGPLAVQFLIEYKCSRRQQNRRVWRYSVTVCCIVWLRKASFTSHWKWCKHWCGR